MENDENSNDVDSIIAEVMENLYLADRLLATVAIEVIDISWRGWQDIQERFRKRFNPSERE
jgi:hypothetical protein